MGSKAVLTISFGTSAAPVREAAIDPLEREVAAAFGDRAAYAAWTSGRIVEKVRAERGEVHDTVEEALARVAGDGADDLLVVPTTLMDGFEMRRIRRLVDEWGAQGATAHVARPLLAEPADRHGLALVLADEYGHVPAHEMVVFMGHGTAGPGNEVYAGMEDEFASLGLAHFAVATVEGEPPFTHALARVQERSPQLVHLVPLMMVAGEHARLDMAGEAPESWASQLVQRGFAVNPVLRGLGEVAQVRALVVAHAREALQQDGGEG